MKNKSIWKVSGLLLLGLFLAGAVIWGMFTRADQKELNETLDKTASTAKIKLQEYEDYTANDRVKSLVRLLDKSKEFRRNISRIDSYRQEDIDEYAAEQRLTGVFAVDGNRDITLQSMQTGELDAQKLWKKISDRDYIGEILEHPEETYMERITVDSKEYDLAVVPRQDTAGLVIAYAEKNSHTQGDMTMDAVFSDFPLSMKGVITVCKDNVVVSTNQTAVLGKTTKDLRNYFHSSLKGNEKGIIRIKPNGKIWYGHKDKMGEYVIYIFFPSSQIFMTRSLAVGLYTAVAMFIYLVVLLIYSNVEKTALRQSQKRMRIINALGTAYSSIILLNLTAGMAEIIKKPDDGLNITDEDRMLKRDKKKLVEKMLASGYQKEYLEFIDVSTMKQRMKGHQLLTCTSQMANGKWIFSVLLPQRFDENGNIMAILLANRDITEEKEKELKQEKELRNALAVAEHANKAKTRFLNSISHDIRTPMNAVIGYTALATSHADNKEMVIEYLKKIHISSQHLLSLINDVLDMSRIESGVVKLEEVNVHLPEIFHDLSAIIQENITAKQQDLYIDTQNVIHEDIITDKLRLNQVLLNIISNAIKFTPVGGMINIRVSEYPCRREGYAKDSFSVKDNGIGMSEEFQMHVFDAFAREQTVTKSGIQGTGLGLAISKNIIHMMGGDITVHSEAGKGSEFIVTMECRVSEKAVKHMPIPELQGARALVVDDDADTCMSVCKMLREIEMIADWTTSGKEAVLRAKEAREMKKEFMAYIIDWQMPDMNGIETVRRIRKVIGNDTPIIILTAYDWTDIAEEAKEAGVTAFVSKPLFMSELKAVRTEQALGMEADLESKNKTKHSHAGKKILLVEDNELNREIATVLLEEAGLIVDFVEDGTDAVERMNEADESEYDLILMDIQMPKMDGYTATREIRTLSNNKKSNIPIVAMTANAFEEDRQKAFKAGMNAHISKPINIDVILHTLDQIFDD